MGRLSPLWTIFGTPSDGIYKYDVYMTNYNSWTWTQSDYVATTTGSVMNVGQFSTDYTTDMPHTTFSPRTIGGSFFNIEQFEFGKTDDSA